MSVVSSTGAIPDMIQDPTVFDADGTFWVKAAQAAIRRTCGWHITPNIELSGVVNSRGGKVIRLPARHVTSVDELTDIAGNRLHYAYDPATGLVECTAGVSRPAWPRYATASTPVMRRTRCRMYRGCS